MRRLAAAALAVAFLAPLAVARADDKADPTGTWKWKVKFGDQEREFTLKLKADGDKLKGAMLGRDGNETPIEEGTFKDGKVAFKITRERDGNKFVIHYTGKVSGDTIKGKTEFERNGEKMEREWEAKRAKD
jgi:hypothetical protein